MFYCLLLSILMMSQFLGCAHTIPPKSPEPLPELINSKLEDENVARRMKELKRLEEEQRLLWEEMSK